MLSRVERATGNTTAAAQAARDAYLQAWCDGPPFSYAAGLDEARANLSAVGVPEPAGLDGFELGEPFPEVFIEPIPPDVSLASLRTGEAFSHSQITAMIEKLGWTAVDTAVTAELDAILGSEVAAPIRVAALRALARIEADAERSRERGQRAVQDQAEEVRAAALLLLDHQADLRGAAILRTLAERDPAKMVREAALPLLAEQESDESFTAIRRIAEHDDDSEIRLRVLETLVKVRDGIIGARPTLLRAVEADPTGRVRSHAAKLLTGLELRTYDALLRRRACEDDDPEVRSKLLMLLAGARQTGLWESLSWSFPNPTMLPPPPIRVRGVDAASELSADVKSFLLERASSDLDMYARATARFLIADSYPEFPPHVLLLDELVAAPASEREPLCIALRAIGNLGRDPAVLAKLVMLLESEESDAVRIEFARWLSYSGHPDAEPALRGLLRAADSEVRRAAPGCAGPRTGQAGPTTAYRAHRRG